MRARAHRPLQSLCSELGVEMGSFNVFPNVPCTLNGLNTIRTSCESPVLCNSRNEMRMKVFRNSG